MSVSSRISLADYRPPSLSPALEVLNKEKWEAMATLTGLLYGSDYIAQQATLLRHQSMDRAIRKLKEADDAAA